MALPVLDFPASPAVGDRYPNPVVTGQPQYRWDGLVWLATDAAIDATDVSVAEDQTFTEAQKAQGRKNIYAAPFDAMAYSGMQINGSMDVSQENGSATVAIPNGTAKYVADGWLAASFGVQRINCSRIATPILAGYPSFLQAQATVANTSVTPTDFCFILQYVEGYRVARLAWGTVNAQPVTLGFWVLTSHSGLYGGSINNGADDRSYPFTFTMNAASTWEYKTITVPGATTGTWATDNNIGMKIRFSLVAGSNYAGPPGIWAASVGYFGASGCVNGITAVNDVMAITGVVVLPGIEAPSAARSPLIMRPFDQELVTCQRYWEAGYGRSVVYGGNIVSGSAYSLSQPFRAVKRTSPMMTFADVASSGFAALPFGGLTINTNGFEVERVANTTMIYGYYICNFVADARL